MAPSKLPTGRIPGSGGRLGAGSSPTPRGVGSFGTNSQGTSSGLGLPPAPVSTPKFQPFRKIPSAGGAQSPAPSITAPAASPAAPNTPEAAATVSAADSGAVRANTTSAAAAAPGGLDANPATGSAGNVPVDAAPTTSDPTAAATPDVAVTKSGAQAAVPTDTMPGVAAHPATPGGEANRGSGSSGAAAALSTGAAARLYGDAAAGGGGGEPQQLQRRLEALLREAAGGAAVGGEDKVKALAAAIVDACKVGATADDPATGTPGTATASQPPQRSSGSSSRMGKGLLGAALGATAVLVAALAMCVAWVVFVLLDRGLVGPGAEQVASLGAGFGAYGGGGYMEG